MSSRSFAEKFEEILKKPALYVGNCSVQKIRAFMDGYIDAKLEDGEKRKPDLYDDFGEWVRNRFQITTSHGWAEIVQFMSPSEAYAFQLTKELWDEYKLQIQEKKI